MNTPVGTPRAETEIDGELVRRLLVSQHPDLSNLTLCEAGSGWDNALFRLGESLAVRLPRRAAVVDQLLHEQRWLPILEPGLPLRIPAPLRVGVPGEGYPWRWSIIPWLEGQTADEARPDPEQGDVLGRFFAALHRPAPEEAPRNPYRGVPLAQRAAAFGARVASLRGRTSLLDERALAIWREALVAPLDNEPPTWIHGDPHPRNLLVRDGRLVAVIDWGDLAQGDRASDLAALWMVLPQRDSRQRAIASLPSVSEPTWRRARGWAVHYSAVFLDTGLHDNAPMAAIGAATLARLQEDRDPRTG